MALTNDNMVMPVAPAYGGGSTGMFGGWDSSAWLILIVLFALGGWGGFGGGMGGGMYEFPWLLNGQQGVNANTNAGFNNLATQNQITAVQSDLGDIQTQLCGGFAGVNATVNGGFANAESSANARQIANMQQAFNSQNAIVGAITDLASQQANCCCENRLATQGLNSTIISENCADRQALNEGVRDILANQNAGIQRILDTMCQDKIDAKNEKIADLERQLTMANLSASQTAQTSRILADNAAQTTALEQYLNPVPIPAYMVQNPNCCTQNYGCGCGSF